MTTTHPDPHTCPARGDCVTLTVAEIIDLAGFAGLTLHSRFSPTDDDLESEITITKCPQGHYAHVAYMTDYPEEGSVPLGSELAAPASPA